MTDADVMARTIYGEARGEGLEGMEAVANVILNRVRKGGWWGETVTAVCLKPYQFSCWNSGDPNRHVIETISAANPVFAQCLQVAEDALDGRLVDHTNHATSYYARSSPTPSWADDREPCALIGRHLFFNDVA